MTEFAEAERTGPIPVGGHGGRGGQSPDVTPPQGDPGRPGVVTAAVVLWTVLGVLMIGSALLFGLALVVGSVDPQTGPLPLVAAMVVLAAGGAGAVVGARRLRSGSRTARTGLTVLGAALAVAGLVQVTFLNVGGVWFVAFAAGALLLHVRPARAWFGREPG